VLWLLYECARGTEEPDELIGLYDSIDEMVVEKHKLSPAACICVGDMTSDRTFSERCGFQFAWAHDFFR
jgi:hypothetical protein